MGGNICPASSEFLAFRILAFWARPLRQWFRRRNFGVPVLVFSDQQRPLKLEGWLVGRFPRRAIWAVLLIACVASLALRQVGTRYEFDLLPKSMAYHEGAAFRAHAAGQVSWPWRRAPDTISDLRRSRLILFEDGRPLGPPHQPHGQISSLGDGRYSHWNNFILFSASDNSDPRTNGRHYHAIDYATLSASVGALPWLLLCIWAVVDLRRSRLIRKLSATYQLLERRIGRLGIFLILTAPIVITANTVIIRHWPLPAVITPDTALYVDFNEVRTIGYPVFLKTVIALFGDLRLLVAIQLNLLLGSILMLGWAVGRVVASLLCGIVLVLVLALNPALLNWTEQLMSEGLFIPVLLAHASLVLLLLKQPSRATAALAGITLVAAILVRPAAYSLLLNLPLLVLLVRREQITILAWTVIPATALYLAASGAHRAVLGTWQSQSFGGYNLLGNVALLIHGDVPGAPPVGEEIYRRIATQVRDAETKKFPTELWVYTADLYSEILYREVTPVLLDYVKRTEPNLSAFYGAVWQQTNSVAWSLALRVIEQDPVGYLRLVLAQYYGLWSMTLADGGSIGEGYVVGIDQGLLMLRQNADLRSWAHHFGLGEETLLNARAAYLKNSESYDKLDEFLEMTIPAYRLGLVSIAACVVFLFCPYWLLRLLRGRPVHGPPAALLYLGVSLTGYYLLVASVEVAYPRYVEAFEGITLTIDIIALSVAITYSWAIIRTISSAVRGICYRKHPAEMGCGSISAAEVGRG